MVAHHPVQKKRKYQRYSEETKKEAVSRVKKGEVQAKVAKDLGISLASLAIWLRNKRNGRAKMVDTFQIPVNGKKTMKLPQENYQAIIKERDMLRRFVKHYAKRW